MSTEQNAPNTLPHWDMTVVYPSLESTVFETDFQALIVSISALAAHFDDHHIYDGAPKKSEEMIVATFDETMNRYNTLLDNLRTMRAYISSFISTNSRNTLAQAKMSELQRHMVTLSQLGTRFTAWIGTLDLETLIPASKIASEHAHYLNRTQFSARHLMSPSEESLYSELYLSGGGAWSKLYADTVSQMSIPFDGVVRPMSAIRGFSTDADADLRRRAYETEIATWESTAVPIAAALNALKYEANTLSRRRGWDSPLDVSLFLNGIDRETLTAMLAAAQKSFPDFRRYLRAKAKVVSQSDALPWYDLFAPVGDDTHRWEWNEAEMFVAEQFGTYSAKMRSLAERSFREHWIDAEPRLGKHDGAFCMGLRGDESRIGQNYRPAYSGVSTLAHELGHAYHNLCLAGRTPMQRNLPMTLAETASIFCETIVRRAALEKADKVGQLAILEASLQSNCQVVVDITSRYLFESRVLEHRRERELSVQELCETMRIAQIETYGDGLDARYLHPYAWAAKSHYYGSTFYNYPYMFGLLFGLGLFAHYEQSPETFAVGYDDLLSRTGMEDAWTLAERWQIDIRSEAFWASSLAIIRRDIDRFVALTAL